MFCCREVCFIYTLCL